MYQLIIKYRSILSNGEGGINSDGIRLLLDIENIPEKEHTITTAKIIAYLTAAILKQMEK